MNLLKSVQVFANQNIGDSLSPSTIFSDFDIIQVVHKSDLQGLVKTVNHKSY